VAKVPFNMLVQALDRGTAYYFLYLAFAPGPKGTVVIKVGISQKPLERVVEVHYGSPFPIEFAAYTPVGPKSRARKVETAIISGFQTNETRGEWLIMDDTPENRTDFARACLTLVRQRTKIPVTWAKLSGETIAAESVRKTRKAYGLAP
jgi:hypothetical protein